MSDIELVTSSTRRESMPRVRREFTIEPSLFPFIMPLLDQAVADGELDLAHKASEYFYSKHEGSYSQELFQVGLLDISLPFQQWMKDPNYNLTQQQRMHAYEMAVNLSGLAIEYAGLHSSNEKRAMARGIVSEALFYAGTTRLMASSPHIPLVVIPAPLWMDKSTAGAKKRDGIDFITYYHDTVIPIQIKSSRGVAGKPYRDEILTIYMKDFTYDEDWDLSSLQSVLQSEVQAKEPSMEAQSFQEKLFAKIDEHATSKRELLLGNENVLLTKG